MGIILRPTSGGGGAGSPTSPFGTFYPNPTSDWVWGFDDADSNTVGNASLGMEARNSGGSLQRVALDPSWDNRKGVYIAQISTTQISGMDNATDRQIYFGDAQHIFRGSVYINALATAAEDYDFRIGFDNNTLSTDPSDAAYIQYQRSTSANWITVTNDGGTKTSNTSGTAVSTGWHTFEIHATNDTNVVFKVDGTTLATHTTDLPVNGNTHYSLSFIGTAGSGTKSFYIDFLQGLFKSTTVRGSF